jgi:hypothetical protein
VNRTRQFGFAVGIILVIGGLAVVFIPGVAGGVRTGSAFLILIGLVALLAGGLAVRARFTASNTQKELSTPERKRTHPTPGDEFDSQLASLTPRGRRQGARERRAVRDRLDEVAISVLVRDGDSEAVAREQLTRGTWTDDPHAAAFFAEERAADVPIEDRFRVAFSSEPNSRKQARHAIDALARIADTERER